MNNQQAKQLMLIQALSPLHPGTGQSVADIDLPIAREKATGLPYLPGSSVKGVLRDACREQAYCEELFGPPPGASSGNLFAGMLQFTDMHVLLMPIRSLAGTFAWVTAPYILRRFARTASEAGLSVPADIPTIPQHACSLAADSSVIYHYKQQQQVCLEDLVFTEIINDDQLTNTWATFLAERCFDDSSWRSFLQKRLCVVHDDVFSFLLKTATEIIARILIDSDTKTVKKGGLWYEEALPTETILAGMVVATKLGTHSIQAPDGLKHLKGLTKDTLQFGGNATVGRGLCKVTLSGV